MLMNVFALLWLLTLTKGRSTENDDILDDVMPTVDMRIQKRNQLGDFLPMNKPQYMKRDSHVTTNDANDSTYTVKTDAADIVGDVDKYGLYEYTSDNTGMADQLKKLIDKAHNKETHVLENKANQINDRINKYIESNQYNQPTIDPMETPDGYHPTVAPISAMMNGQHSDTDVITIPNTMTIEDEHGRALDDVKEKLDFKMNPATTTIKSSLMIHKPSPKVLHQLPTTSLTYKLYKALKTNKGFLKNVQRLLGQSQNTPEGESGERNQPLPEITKSFRKPVDAEEINSESKVDISNMQKAEEVDDTAKDNRLMRVIKKLIGSERNQQPVKTQSGSLDDTSSKNENTQLSKLKNLLEKQRKNNAFTTYTSSNGDSFHPLGTDTGSPLMGFLESETDMVTKVKDNSQDAKEDVQRLESELDRQNKPVESTDVHNQELLTEIKKLLKTEKIDSDKDDDDEKMGSDIFNFLTTTHELKQYLSENTNGKNNSEWIQKFMKLGFPNSVRNVTEEGKEKDPKPQDAKMLKEQNAVAEQLKEIQREKEILKEKENHLKEISKQFEEKTEGSATKEKESRKQNEEKEKEGEELEKKIKEIKKEAYEKLQSEERKAKEKSEDKHKIDEKTSNVDNLKTDEAGKEENSSSLESGRKMTASQKLQSEEEFHHVPIYENQMTDPQQKERGKKYDDEEKLAENRNTRPLADVHVGKETSLGLPINNPKPNTDDSIVPHANFHHSNSDIVLTTTIIKETNSATRDTPTIITEPQDNKELFIKSTKEPVDTNQEFIVPTVKRHSHIKIPPAGMGKPRVNIDESEYKDVDKKPASVKESKSEELDQSKKKHVDEDSYPERLDPFSEAAMLLKSNGILMKNSGFDKGSRRFIKPRSGHHMKMIDVPASKKGFGKLPVKPNGYASATNRINTTRNSASNATQEQFITPKHKKRRKYHRTNQRVLTPADTTNKIITINKTDDVSTNVIIPGSVNRMFQSGPHDVDGGGEGTDPGDITRSILPKASEDDKKKLKQTSIEAVFEIIGSSDKKSNVIKIPGKIVNDNKKEKMSLEIVEENVRKIDIPIPPSVESAASAEIAATNKLLRKRSTKRHTFANVRPLKDLSSVEVSLIT